MFGGSEAGPPHYNSNRSGSDGGGVVSACVHVWECLLQSYSSPRKFSAGI